MVLCGEYADRSVVELLEPPAGAKAGDPIVFEGFERCPEKELKAIKLKDEKGQKYSQTAWDRLVPTLNISAEGVARIGEVAFGHALGNVTVPTVKNGIVK